MHEMGMDCAMNMVFTWQQPIGVCLVFPSLQITGPNSMTFYLIFLVLVSLIYEYSRLYATASDKKLKESLRSQLNTSGSTGGLTPVGSVRRTSLRREENGEIISGSEEGLLGSFRSGRSVRLPWSIHTKRSVLYVVNVAVSFWIMLIVMSFNAYLIGAILLGAFIGHMLFQRDITLIGSEEDKGLACH